MTEAPVRLAAALADRYRLERELGAGGMATVYLAHDIKHDRKVAIKVLRPELAAVIGAERFLREIKTIANLQHPHILGLIDSGKVNGTAYYVMPFVEGESLRDRLNREKQLPITDAVRLATEVAGALGYAHRHGVIHRDIKPENILLHDGLALLADFGIALAVSSAGGRMTETGMSLGTPHYMSPEQAMGEREIGPTSDVYALGVVTYEMLTGEPPFSGPTAQAIFAKVMTEKPAPIMLRRDTVPETIARAVVTALQKIPADRFRNTAEFIAALTATSASPGGPGAHTRTVSLVTGSFVITEAHCRLLSRASFDPRLIGSELQYFDNGVASPVLLCFIPAFGRGSDQNMEMLSRIGYRAVVPTLRGFELDTPWRPTLTIDDHIVLIREFLRELATQLEPALIIVAGFSTAADIALRFAAAPDPAATLRVDGCLTLGGNLAPSTCFFTSVLASMKNDDDDTLLAALRQVSDTATSLDEWVNICQYALRIASTFRNQLGVVRTFASGLWAPFATEELTPFANWYRAAMANGCRLSCVFEDTPMYRGLVRELQLRNLDEGLLGERYEEGSIINEAGTSHFDLVEPGRVARHVDALVTRLRGNSGARPSSAGSPR